MSEPSRRWAAPQLGGAVQLDEPSPTPSNQANSLALARSKAAAIVARAEGEARQVLAQARHEGLQEGIELGRRQAEAELEELRRHWQVTAQAELEALQRLGRESHARLWGEVQENVADLALALCEKVLGERLASRPELLTASLNQALEEFSGAAEVTLRLHPDQLALGEGLGTTVRVVGDPSLKPGDFLAEGAQGTVDGRLTTRLRRLGGHLNSHLATADN